MGIATTIDRGRPTPNVLEGSEPHL
jgi:hypothetical protein